MFIAIAARMRLNLVKSLENNKKQTKTHTYTYIQKKERKNFIKIIKKHPCKIVVTERHFAYQRIRKRVNYWLCRYTKIVQISRRWRKKTLRSRKSAKTEKNRTSCSETKKVKMGNSALRYCLDRGWRIGMGTDHLASDCPSQPPHSYPICSLKLEFSIRLQQSFHVLLIDNKCVIHLN